MSGVWRGVTGVESAEKRCKRSIGGLVAMVERVGGGRVVNGDSERPVLGQGSRTGVAEGWGVVDDIVRDLFGGKSGRAA